jgi:hypothetical protein
VSDSYNYNLTGSPCWINISGPAQDLDSNGQICFPVDLEGLSSLTGLTNCDNNPITLTDLTCPTADGKNIGFRVHYQGAPTLYAGSFSAGTDLSLSCSICGENTNFTIGLSLASGSGNPCPGSYQCYTYILTVQNCTAHDLTNVKIQGGTAGWLDQSVTAATSDVLPQPQVKAVGKGKNKVITWTGSLASGSEVNITVHVCGTVASTDGTTEFLNGPWSATGTTVADPNTGYPGGELVTTGYTGQLSITTDSTNCTP